MTGRYCRRTEVHSVPNVELITAFWKLTVLRSGKGEALIEQ